MWGLTRGGWVCISRVVDSKMEIPVVYLGLPERTAWKPRVEPKSRKKSAICPRKNRL